MATTTKVANFKADVEEAVVSHSLWWDVWTQFRKHTLAMIAVATLIFIVLAILSGPLASTAARKSMRNMKPSEILG